MISADENNIVSVIVPAYNAAAFIGRCIESLIQQTYNNLQIIIIDDGSEDATQSVVQEKFREQIKTSSEFPSITLLHQNHSGQSAARNFGLKHTKGKYVIFVDADDYINTDYIELLVKSIGGYDIVQTGYTKINIAGDTLYTQYPQNKYQFTSACMRLYKRELLDGILFQNGIYYEDILFSADVWSKNPKILMLKNFGYYYTLNPSSTTSTPHPQDKQSLFHLLKKKLHNADFRASLKILYTIARARMYFLFQS